MQSQTVVSFDTGDYSACVGDRLAPRAMLTLLTDYNSMRLGDIVRARHSTIAQSDPMYLVTYAHRVFQGLTSHQAGVTRMHPTHGTAYAARGSSGRSIVLAHEVATVAYTITGDVIVLLVLNNQETWSWPPTGAHGRPRPLAGASQRTRPSHFARF